MKIFIQAMYVLVLLPATLFAQETVNDTVPNKPERAAFESSFIIDNPTDLVFDGKSMEIQIKHRFGVINSGNNDLAGIWAPANIRLGVTYAVHDRVTLGFGTTKFDRLQDLSMKIGLLRQTRSGSMPVNITYYGNFTIDAREKDLFENDQDRFSFFNQIILSRRFNRNLSLVLAPSISHYNKVVPGLKNDVYALAFGGRYKVSPQTSVLFDYSHPFTDFEEDLNPHPGLSLGVEFATAGHAFQLLLSNYDGLVSQRNLMYNRHDFFKGDILIGFNITRVYKF